MGSIHLDSRNNLSKPYYVEVSLCKDNDLLLLIRQSLFFLLGIKTLHLYLEYKT
jgi:hypothetical protein